MRFRYPMGRFTRIISRLWIWKVLQLCWMRGKWVGGGGRGQWHGCRFAIVQVGRASPSRPGDATNNSVTAMTMTRCVCACQCHNGRRLSPVSMPDQRFQRWSCIEIMLNRPTSPVHMLSHDAASLKSVPQAWFQSAFENIKLLEEFRH